MNKILTISGIIAFLMLSSCGVLDKYQSPEATTAGLFRDQHSEDTTTIANIPWRDYFNDPILRNMIEEGLSNNFDMQIAFTRIRQAEVNLGIAKAAYFPNVALVGQVNQARSSVKNGEKDVLGAHSESYTLGISATWELDIWGKLNRQSKANYAQFLSTHAYKNLIQTSLISNIATSYYSLLALDEQLRVTNETIGLLQESLETMQAMMDAGLTNAAAVEQSKALLYSTQVSVPDLNTQIQKLENSLSILMGRTPGPISRRTIYDQSIIPQLAYGVPAQMLAKRPDVQQAELGFRSAFELKNAAQVSLYPSITLNTGSMIGYGAASLSNFFKPENIFANIIGGIAQPLFAKKQLLGQLEIRKAQEMEALLTFEQTVLNAGKEVSDILFAYESSLRKNEPRTKQVEALTTAVDFTHELLKAGEANYLEVISAEQSMLQAKLNQISDRLEQLQYSVQLYKALGGGVE